MHNSSGFSNSDQVKINEKLKKQLEIKTQEVLDLTAQIAHLKTEGDLSYILEQNYKLHQEKCKFQDELKNVKADHETLLAEILSRNDSLTTEIERLSAVPAGSVDTEELSKENKTLRSKINSLATENFELINKERIAVIIDSENTDLRERLKYLDLENKQLKEEAKSLEVSEAKKKKYDKHIEFSEEETDKLPEIDELTELRRKLERQDEAHKQELKDLIEENRKLSEENQSLMFIMQENTNEAEPDSLLAKTLDENERLKAALVTTSNTGINYPIGSSPGESEKELKTLRERQAYFDSLLECDLPTKDALLIAHTAEIERLQEERNALSNKVTRYTRMANSQVNNQDDGKWQIANTAISDLERSNNRILELEAENFKLKIGITMRAQTNEESHSSLAENFAQEVQGEFLAKREKEERDKQLFIRGEAQLKEAQEKIASLESASSNLREIKSQLECQIESLNRELNTSRAEANRLAKALEEERYRSTPMPEAPTTSAHLKEAKVVQAYKKTQEDLIAQQTELNKKDNEIYKKDKEIAALKERISALETSTKLENPQASTSTSSRGY